MLNNIPATCFTSVSLLMGLFVLVACVGVKVLYGLHDGLLVLFPMTHLLNICMRVRVSKMVKGLVARHTSAA